MSSKIAEMSEHRFGTGKIVFIFCKMSEYTGLRDECTGKMCTKNDDNQCIVFMSFCVYIIFSNLQYQNATKYLQLHT